MAEEAKNKASASKFRTSINPLHAPQANTNQYNQAA